MNKISNHIPLVLANPQPAEQPKNEKLAKVDQRIANAAKEPFKGYQCFKNFKELMTKIGLKIKSIPKYIADVLSRCLSTEDDDDDDFDVDILEEEEYEDQEALLEQQNLEKNKKFLDVAIPDLVKNADPAVLKTFFVYWDLAAKKINNKIALMKFKTVDDLRKYYNISFALRENLEQLSSLKTVLTAPDIAEDVKKAAEIEFKKLSEKLGAADRVFKEKCDEKKDKIRKLQEAAKIVKAHQNDQVKAIAYVPSAFLEDIKKQKAVHSKHVPPPLQNNGRNNCWFHAVLEMLWSMGDDFHQMVNEMVKNKDILVKDYQKELAWHQKNLVDFEKRKATYQESLLKVQVYENALNKYKKEKLAFEKQEKASLDAFEAKVIEYKKAMQKYAEDLKAWENDKTKEKPAEPKEPEPVKGAPQEPAEIRADAKPVRPRAPSDPLLLLNALKSYSDAIQAGELKEIQECAEGMQKAIMNAHPEYQAYGIQHDAPPFLEKILQFLSQPSCLLKMERTMEGKAGTMFEGLKSVVPENNNLLQLVFYDKTEKKIKNSNFQDILDINFQPEEVFNDPANAWVYEIENEKKEIVKKVNVTHYTIKQTISNKQNPPDILFVHMKRFDNKKPAEIAEEREKVEKIHEEKIKHHAEELLKKEPEKYKDLKEAEKAAEETLKARKVHVNYDQFMLRKINDPIDFPENHKVNFAKAFGVQDGDISNYDYVLCSTVIQNGVSIQDGHYKANVNGLDPKNGQQRWYHTDDVGAQVIPYDAKQALDSNKQGYIYFFRKVKKPHLAG